MPWINLLARYKTGFCQPPPAFAEIPSDAHRGLYLCSARPTAPAPGVHDYRLAGKRKTFCIGVCPEVSLENAREHHAEARKLGKSW